MLASIHLTKVAIGDITNSDLEGLTKALDYDKATMLAQDVLMKVLQGVYAIWRFEGGFVVGHVASFKTGKELFVIAIAGDGLVLKANELLVGLKELGKELGCRAITTELQTKELVRFYKTRLGFEITSTVMELEI